MNDYLEDHNGIFSIGPIIAIVKDRQVYYHSFMKFHKYIIDDYYNSNFPHWPLLYYISPQPELQKTGEANMHLVPDEYKYGTTSDFFNQDLYKTLSVEGSRNHEKYLKRWRDLYLIHNPKLNTTRNIIIDMLIRKFEEFDHMIFSEGMYDKKVKYRRSDKVTIYQLGRYYAKLDINYNSVDMTLFNKMKKFIDYQRNKIVMKKLLKRL